MNTVMVWLLVAHAAGYMGSGGGVSTVATFADKDECLRVQRVLENLSSYNRVQCIQARVVKP